MKIVNIKELKFKRLIQNLELQKSNMIFLKRDCIKKQEFQKASYYRDMEKQLIAKIDKIKENEKN